MREEKKVLQKNDSYECLAQFGIVKLYKESTRIRIPRRTIITATTRPMLRSFLETLLYTVATILKKAATCCGAFLRKLDGSMRTQLELPR